MKSRRAREIESVLFAMYAAVPLYLTGAVSPVSVALFHVAMALIILRMSGGRSRLEVPVQLLGVGGFMYLLFFPFDVLFVSHSLIRSSAHLLFFIAAYQVLESAWRDNGGQRILVTFLIFVTSVATSTHLSILAFVIGFVWLVFRQLMHLSYLKTTMQTGVEYEEAPAGRGALVFVAPTIVVAAMLFPILPRLHSPLTGRLSSSLDRRTTGISETIDFSVERRASSDPEVVARVWMDSQARALFAPLRLRAAVYDEYWNGEWRGSRTQRDEVREVPLNNDGFALGRSRGPSETLTVQQRSTSQFRIYLPVGTHTVKGLRWLFRRAELYYAPELSQGPVTFDVEVSEAVLPLRTEHADVTGYPVTPQIAELAGSVAGGATSPTEIASRIETWLRTNFRYVPNVNEQGRPITVDEFLLRDRRGHCEYFAAGMVAMMTALHVPARIVGGFYGGRYNPLGGYYVFRRSDAHAWVEVFDGTRWVTYDPTPPDLRPGTGDRSILGSYFYALSESVNFFWDRWVLTFGALDQIRFAADAFDMARRMMDRVRAGTAGAVAILPRVFALLGSLVILALIVAGWRMWPGRKTPYEELIARLRGLGIEIDDATTAEEIVEHVRRERPDLVGIVEPIVEAYLVERFSSHPPGEGLRDASARALASLRLADAQSRG